MYSSRYSEGSRSTSIGVVRYYAAWAFCGLLLLFCANAGAARYVPQRRNLKLATSQSFLASEEAKLEAAIAALLLMGCVAILRMPRFIATPSSNIVAPTVFTHAANEYDRELHLRAPPRA